MPKFESVTQRIYFSVWMFRGENGKNAKYRKRGKKMKTAKYMKRGKEMETAKYLKPRNCISAEGLRISWCKTTH